MTWYRSGTVVVTNGSANVTLTGGDALQNIFPDDGFVGPDGRTYAIQTIGGASAFTLQTNYGGATASGQAYGIIPTSDYVQLREALEQINTLITAYQTIALNAGTGLFAVGNAAAPGVRGQGHTGTGLVWNGDDSLSISVAGTIVATFGATGMTLTFPDGVVGTPGIRFANDTNTGFYRPGTDIIGAVTGGAERARIDASGNVVIGGTTAANTAGFDRQLEIDGPVPCVTLKGLTGSRSYSLGVNGDGNLAMWDNTAAAYRFLLGSNGNLGIGAFTGAPTVRLSVLSSGEMFRMTTTTARGGGLCAQYWYDPTGMKGYLGYAGANDQIYIMNNLNAAMLFGTNGVDRWVLDALGNWAPILDNTKTLGGPANRMTTVYATTGTINTSDEDEKDWRGGLTKAELKAGTRIISEIGLYKWKDGGKRIHVGVRAQQVWRIMSEEGLVEPITDGKPGKTPYAFLCWDEWDELIEPIMGERTVPAVYKGRGAKRVEIEPERIERYDTGKTQVTREADSRYGVRTDQLTLFLIAAQEARIAALEERLNND